MSFARLAACVAGKGPPPTQHAGGPQTQTPLVVRRAAQGRQARRAAQLLVARARLHAQGAAQLEVSDGRLVSPAQLRGHPWTCLPARWPLPFVPRYLPADLTTEKVLGGQLPTQVVEALGGGSNLGAEVRGTAEGGRV